MANKELVLTEEKFSEIYSDMQFCKKVANAYKYYDSKMVFIHLKTCSYPIEYIVTIEQIEIAKQEVEKQKQLLLNSIENKLVFVGMGMTYKSLVENDVCNYRIRTNIVNKNNQKFFVEFGTTNQYIEKEPNVKYIRVDYAIDLTDPLNQKYNHNNLERKNLKVEYTLDNILKIVNYNFDCNFTEILIDNHLLSTDEYKSISL